VEYKDAYYQLILYPVKACANLNDMYYNVRLNRLYAAQGRMSANDVARRANVLFEKDAELSRYYNQTMSGGKWNHFMDQLHIGYVGWHDTFGKNTLPELKNVTPVPAGSLGIAIEGSNDAWPGAKAEAILPEFNPYQKVSHYIDVFRRGASPVEFTVQAEPWIRVSQSSGIVEKDFRIMIDIDWNHAPSGLHRGLITIAGKDDVSVTVQVTLNNPAEPKPEKINGFVETAGYVSIESEHFSRGLANSPITWQILPDYGRTLSAVTAFPVTSPNQEPGGSNAHLEYDMYLFSTGKVSVNVYVSPTINFKEGDGLHYGISFDDEKPQIMTIDAKNNRDWEESVKDNIRIITSEHTITTPGQHTLKFWMVDPAVVLQKIVVDAGGLKPSYLGPPESTFHK